MRKYEQLDFGTKESESERESRKEEKDRRHRPTDREKRGLGRKELTIGEKEWSIKFEQRHELFTFVGATRDADMDF